MRPPERAVVYAHVVLQRVAGLVVAVAQRALVGVRRGRVHVLDVAPHLVLVPQTLAAVRAHAGLVTSRNRTSQPATRLEDDPGPLPPGEVLWRRHRSGDRRRVTGGGGWVGWSLGVWGPRVSPPAVVPRRE